MKDFIQPGSSDCIVLTDHTPACETCNNAGKIFSSKTDFLVFNSAVKDQAKKKSSCYYKSFYFFILLMLTIPSIKAQPDLNYAVQANIIYRFTKYIDWPSYNNSGDFVIGVIGNTPLYGELKGFIANKTVGSRKIVLEKMYSSSDTYNCHILFISEEKSKWLTKIAAKTRGSAILIISETSDQALKGSCINFVIVDERLKLEINKSNIEDRDLNIASELLRLGTIVK
ncbi:MAG: YfiR family protein [Ferruginibacter sp.]